MDFDKLAASKAHQKTLPSNNRIGVCRVNELRTLADIDGVAAYMLGKTKPVNEAKPTKRFMVCSELPRPSNTKRAGKNPSTQCKPMVFSKEINKNKPSGIKITALSAP